jgi:ABC-type multidrug transport system fused ATPase/permease subunit
MMKCLGIFRALIVFDRVSFQYPSDLKPVLQDINLTIRPGEHIALVGENGAGKTTLVKLLCRLYDPTSGAITLDGVDIRDYSTRQLPRNISVVSGLRALSAERAGKHLAWQHRCRTERKTPR